MKLLFANIVVLALRLLSLQVSATSHGFRGTSLTAVYQEPGAPAAAEDLTEPNSAEQTEEEAFSPAPAPFAAAESPYAAPAAADFEAVGEEVKENIKNIRRDIGAGIDAHHKALKDMGRGIDTKIQDLGKDIDAGLPDEIKKLKPKMPKMPENNDLGPALWVLFVFAPLSAIVGLAFVVITLRMDELAQVSDLEVVERVPENLDEDVYGAGIATLVRDSYQLVAGKGDIVLRLCRLGCSFLLMVFVICLQILVIVQMQALVAARAVTVIREIYDRFEFIMYGSDESHCYLTANGFHRGKSKEYFNMANFDKLNDEEKESCCSIPFSQMSLLVPILFIWSLTIVSDLRRCGDLFVRLIISTPTIASMKDSTEEGEGEEHVIVGLTKEVKGLLLFTCIIPRYFISWYLLWLGCRWLVATPSFTDLLLNSVALEFIVLLKDALYVAVVPDRNKRATQNTLIQPWEKMEQANYRVFLSSFVLVGAAFAWVYYYIYRFQAVLPDYKWDVHDTCMAYIQESTSGKAR